MDMAEELGAGAGKGKRPRRFGGFRPAGALIAAQTSTAAGKRGYADARLKALWRDIVGQEIAGLAAPVKLTPTRGPAGGLLTLGVQGANGPQVQMLLPLIRERVNGALGPGTVGRVRITQAAGFAEPGGTFARPAPDPGPSVAEVAELAAPLSSIGDDALRAALETLAQNVLSRARKSMSRGS